MLSIRALISFNRKIANSIQSTKTVILNSSKNVQTVGKRFSGEFSTDTCRCSSNLSRSSQRNRSSIVPHDRHKKQISGIDVGPMKPFEFRELSTINNLPIIYLFTKDGCTLCDEAKEALRPHMHRFILKEVDITLPENEHWFDMYKYDIPVFHIYEEFLFKHRVDFDALESGLEKYKDGFKSSK